ncbi:VOC family protein [Candidatus Xianfuyuplasma coldseepsis]|uniref:Uncharacterized protein n=1 Tax=Candidatus Xianfuyuplasma coldseepsis TaxID=2782163 RepID=A0A7L7KQQ3_9MOLU|nr:hypothetical protein [Xianfuyuplasma coldseepsis]QMS85150.1 hypothetical protein G4Z02_05120 [Xianfuyuplasma coldseepsis]
MYRYPSSIVFLYYDNFAYGTMFMEDVLEVQLVMDQGFARVYQISSTSYIGIVQKQVHHNDAGSTLISLNTATLQEEYNRIQQLNVENCTEIQYMKQIPLHSFFFEDKEGHRFEIQQFDNDENLKQFTRVG